MKVDGMVTCMGRGRRCTTPSMTPRCSYPAAGSRQSDGRYEAIMRVGVAGMRGTFVGTVTPSNANPPADYTLTVEGTFSGGFIKRVGRMTLTPEGDTKTKVTYHGD
jgi:carbon monoxide dehydrogenase subunit G